MLARASHAEYYVENKCSVTLTDNPKSEGGVSMRFMMLMIPEGYESAAPGTMPDAKAVEAMMQYNKSLQEAGVLLSLEGLHPPSMDARVTFSRVSQ
jgi:hypothetical protein